MNIRLATEPDIRGVVEITNDAIANTTAHFGIEAEEPDDVLRSWRETREYHPWLAAVDDVCRADAGNVLGFAKASAWNSRCSYDWAAEVTIYIRPEHHRKGIGRALYTRLFKILELQGYRTLLAGITLPNDASVALHERMGMTRVATLHRVGHKFGRWRDVGYWQCWFGEPEAPPRPITRVQQVETPESGGRTALE